MGVFVPLVKNFFKLLQRFVILVTLVCKWSVERSALSDPRFLFSRKALFIFQLRDFEMAPTYNVGMYWKVEPNFLILLSYSKALIISNVNCKKASRKSEQEYFHGSLGQPLSACILVTCPSSPLHCWNKQWRTNPGYDNFYDFLSKFLNFRQKNISLQTVYRQTSRRQFSSWDFVNFLFAHYEIKLYPRNALYTLESFDNFSWGVCVYFPWGPSDRNWILSFSAICFLIQGVKNWSFFS